VLAVAVSGTNLFVGTGGGVFLSTNNGTNWTAASTGLTITWVVSLAVSGTNLFAGTYSGGVFRALESALPVQISTISVKIMATGVKLEWRSETEINNYGFEVERRTSGESSAKWRKIGFVAGSGTSASPHEYSFTDRDLAPDRYVYRIKQIDRDGSFEYYGNAEVEILAPSRFSLDQNYPNPFNPSTTIHYGLPSQSNVRLIITTTLGQQVAVLENGEHEAGYHEVTWHANVASGMYFYRFESVSVSDPNNRFVQVKKMLMLK
jgi:hypothetical protein